MTSGWKFRTTLCGILLVLGSTRHDGLMASETHDSCYLCGWADQQEDAWKVEEALNAEIAESSIPDVKPIDDLEAPEEIAAEDSLFFRIHTDEGLTITTCDYDQWLAWQLKNAGWENESIDEDRSGEALIDAAMTALNSVTTIGKEVRFGQWIEPFAMVGPQDSHTVEQIQAFLEWVTSQDNRQPLENAVADRLVGSSPIITTIEEAYSPYDVTVGRSIPTTQDYVVWNDGLFISRNQPFCIHSCLKVREPGWGPLGDKAPEQPIVEDGRVADLPVVGDTNGTRAGSKAVDQLAGDDVLGSPECLEDEWLWRVGSIWQQASSSGQRLRPEMIGSKVAQVVVKCDECLEIAANRLALVWPKERRQIKPIIGAGAKLLARAEVAEREESKDAVKDFDDSKLAQANAILMRWVDAAQQVVEVASQRWSGVAEVARNRGAQAQSQTR